jgi:hypothetical protein
MQESENNTPLPTPEQESKPIVSKGNMFVLPGHNGGEPIIVVEIDDDGSGDFSVIVSRKTADGAVYSGLGTARADQVSPDTKVLRHLDSEELTEAFATALANGEKPSEQTVEKARAYLKGQPESVSS